MEKEHLLSDIDRKRGGLPMPNLFWPFFYQVPRIGKFLLKSHTICMFFAHVCYHYHHYQHDKGRMNLQNWMNFRNSSE